MSSRCFHFYRKTVYLRWRSSSLEGRGRPRWLECRPCVLWILYEVARNLRLVCPMLEAALARVRFSYPDWSCCPFLLHPLSYSLYFPVRTKQVDNRRLCTLISSSQPSQRYRLGTTTSRKLSVCMSLSGLPSERSFICSHRCTSFII